MKWVLTTEYISVAVLKFVFRGEGGRWLKSEGGQDFFHFHIYKTKIYLFDRSDMQFRIVLLSADVPRVIIKQDWVWQEIKCSALVWYAEYQ